MSTTFEGKVRRVLVCGRHEHVFESCCGLVDEFRDSGCEVTPWPSNGDKPAGRLGEFDLVWVHTHDGSITADEAIVIGMAHAWGIPAYSQIEPASIALKKMITTVLDARSALTLADDVLPRAPAVMPFQHYYARVAAKRGYANEGAKECLVLLMEEIGELARAIRKTEGLVRHGRDLVHQGHELADVFLYVIHMANILEIDLSQAVLDKEILNAARALASNQR